MSTPSPLADEIRALAGRRQWRTLVDRVAAAGQAEWRGDAEAEFHYADALWHVGQTAGALDRAREAAPLVRRTRDHRLILNHLNVVGICLFRLGRNREAADQWAEQLDRADRWGDVEFAARASNNLGMLANLRGDPAGALTLYQRAVAGYRRIGFLHGLAQTHHNLALSHRDLGRRRDADMHLRRAMRLGRRAGLPEVVAGAESERAALMLDAGDPSLAEALARRARDRFAAADEPLGAAEALRVMAAAARADGRREEARAWLEEALDAAPADADAHLRGQVQRDRGRLLAELGRDGARAALEEARSLFETLGAAVELEETRALLASLGG